MNGSNQVVYNSFVSTAISGQYTATWTNSSGFSGTPTEVLINYSRVGSVVTCSCYVAELSAGSGNNVGNLTVPISVTWGSSPPQLFGIVWIQGTGGTATGSIVMGAASSTIVEIATSGSITSATIYGNFSYYI